MEKTTNWICSKCGFVKNITLYDRNLKKANFIISPILPRCNDCKSPVDFMPNKSIRYHNKIYILTGPLGSGKTSITERLFTQYGFNAIDQDCVINLVKHKHGLKKVKFNSDEVKNEIQNCLDILMTYENEIAVSLVILPEVLNEYRAMLNKMNLQYKFFYLFADYEIILNRIKNRIRFNKITPEVWVKYFYDMMKPFEKVVENDFVQINSGNLSVDESVENILKHFS